MPLSVPTIKKLVTAQRPGMWAARNGLNLCIAASGSASWSLRYTNRSKQRRLMKLADYEPIDAAVLAGLEAQAAEHLKAIKVGHDPLAVRRSAISQAARSSIDGLFDTLENAGRRNRQSGLPQSESPLITVIFRDAALAYIEQNRSGWKNSKHITQWENTLATYVYPLIGANPAHEITMEDVMRVLQQPYKRGDYEGTLWAGARETASRVRSRIEIIIHAAKAQALADNSNPDRQALWRNHYNPADAKALKHAGLNGKQMKSNHAAMDWKFVPTFAQELQRKSDYSAKSLLLTILCATRTSETLDATWSEFDLHAATWTIPAARMKMAKEHRIPLSDAAIALLRGNLRIQGNEYVFPGVRNGKPLSNMAMLQMLRGMREGAGLTVHGFRSTFRDWITETTLHPDTIAEQALAHTITNKVERAYRRGDAFERRCDLMQQWADYLLLDGKAYGTKWAKLLV
jgi:integrase